MVSSALHSCLLTQDLELRLLRNCTIHWQLTQPRLKLTVYNPAESDLRSRRLHRILSSKYELLCIDPPGMFSHRKPKRFASHYLFLKISADEVKSLLSMSFELSWPWTFTQHHMICDMPLKPGFNSVQYIFHESAWLVPPASQCICDSMRSLKASTSSRIRQETRTYQTW